MRLPDTAIEAAAKAIHACQYRGAMPEDIEAAWAGNPDERKESTEHASAALTAFCEEMGFEEERKTFNASKKIEGVLRPVEQSRLVSKWRAVEGEDR